MTTTKKNSNRKRADHEGTIYYWQSRGKWVAQIRMGTNPRTGRAIKKVSYKNTKAEALQALEELKAKYAVVTHIDADIMTTRDWLLKWYEVFSKPKIRGNTQQLYRRIITIANEEVGNIKLDKLTDIDLQEIIFRRLGLHYRTAQLFRTIMKAAFRRAVKSHLIKESPAEDLELPKKPAKRKFAKPTAEAWRKLIEYPSSRYYGWRWILLTEFVTGARLSEVLGLHWSDLTIHKDTSGNPTSGSLHIQHALYLGTNIAPRQPRPVLLGNTKTSEGNRILPLPPDYCREIMIYRKKQLEQRLMMPAYNDQGFIFTKNDGNPINPSSFSSYYANIRRKLGIATTFHMLRHDMASRMKKNRTFDLKDIQNQLGHSSIQITMDIYTHLDDEQQHEISCWLENGMDEIFGKDTEIPQKAPTKKDRFRVE
ncbi:tyrosine recombinase XerC [Selenomonas sp. ND2010]|uniref:site-specific integrase n=1 Tax=Selenomonas sp. ND2010 TaxID=1410618 RepID=UPI00051B7985|nr:site-specific integrase [Selenomonas sp. ND2010]